MRFARHANVTEKSFSYLNVELGLRGHCFPKISKLAT